MKQYSSIPRVWHFSFWSIYFLFKVYHEFVWIYPKYESLTAITALKTAALAQGIILLPKVLFTYWIIQILLENKSNTLVKIFKFMIGLFITLIAHQSLAVYVALPFAYQDEIPDSVNLLAPNRVSSALIDILFVAGIATALITLHRNKQAKARERALEKEKTIAELRLLRQQTNPHFLLNTLNNLYVLARKKSDLTSEAILKLSKLMKYVLYDANLEKVALASEITLIEDYMELEKLRYGDRLQLHFEIKGTIKGKIPPMILHALVENAFKHGASESMDSSKINILLKVENQYLTFKVENTYEQIVAKRKPGIGLTNLKRQLELAYPDHQLDIQSDGAIYQALLKIRL